MAGGSRPLTVLFAALAVWVLGLAVPVTASYIISAVMIAPALTQVGIAPVAAHMFIFYYAVLSDVSPPTALSPYAAAAITGGDAMRTTLLTWKYTLPAFIVPFAFTLAPEGMGLLLRAPIAEVLRASLSAALGVGALAMCCGGWLRRAATPAERAAAGVAGLLLVYPGAAADVVRARALRARRRPAPGPRAFRLNAMRARSGQRKNNRRGSFHSVTARRAAAYNPQMCANSNFVAALRCPGSSCPGGSVGEP